MKLIWYEYEVEALTLSWWCDSTQLEGEGQDMAVTYYGQIVYLQANSLQ